MKILYIGSSQNYYLWQEGKNPSHWLYGACEMENDGHKVLWAQEKYDFFNDLRLINQYQPDKIFIPNLNLHAHILLLILAACKIIRIPIFAYLHHSPKKNKGIKWLFYHFIMSGVNHMFFLSELSMQETVERGYISSNKCSTPGWGADMDFFNNIPKEDNGTFVSTGKEQRDFDLLIEAFKQTGASLKIITSKNHAGNNHEDLPKKCKDIPNIEVTITENTGEVYPHMLYAMASAKAIVCPLRSDKLNYCVGISSVADSEGLQKPLIITRNPYHSKNRLNFMHVVEDLSDWIKAIKEIQLMESKIPQSTYNIKECYKNMKSVMFK
ncbi:hypothetical protein [Plebeiibacterium sediminum]|uniref:Uncharacterized protein n=1 Tax=Plebeiibacterium sediminum TaxID=2992112 RepID=A0AAE3SEX0_9BACT|nr:hypothetical protein [Plebeiobacterium sediminum]MCW3786646.1 hypothetical protein [Plebeiobacterium sediminum]